MTKYSATTLRSTDTLAIARTLSDMQIDIIKADKTLGGTVVGERLEQLRDTVWNSDSPENNRKSVTDDDLKKGEDHKKQVFDKAIDGLDKEQKEQLLASYARMGHFYDIAAITARSNYIAEIKHKKDPRKTVPGGIEEVIRDSGHQSVDELVERLNKPVFEIVMTAHPTNVNSLDSMKAQREIDKALDNRDEAALKKAMVEYQKTPLVNYTKDAGGEKHVTNLTVQGETQTALYFLDNLYEDLPKAYKTYDEALSKYAKEKHSSYDPTALALNIKFGSWASAGDKDGNNNVTAESTLEAIALHTQAILKHYSEDLGHAKSPELAKWKTGFDAALVKLEPLVADIEQLRKDAKDPSSSPAKLNERFDKLSGKLAKVRSGLDRKGFETDLKSAAGMDKEALNLLRSFHTFGFEFSKIEYRETAKEYGRTVGELVDGYKALSPEQKVEKLTDLLLQPGNEAAKLFAKKEAEIVHDGAGRAYTKESAKPIAYHTLKRMTLARDFRDMIKDNVLAECGQLKFEEDKTRKPTEAEIVAQGVANILEAEFLQKAVEKNGRRAVMGVVPLFEEPGTMAHIDKIMGAAYKNEAYKQQLEAVKRENKTEKPIQQVMIAHSDNARRSGLQAARAYIHEAHHKIRGLNEERKQAGQTDIQTQFFEGGSVSDAYRNGVRALSASVNAFGLQDFAKFTFQGGDLLNYFNHPDSTARLIERQISHQAKSLEKNGHGGWVAKVREGGGRAPDPRVEKNVVDALKATLADYQKNDFTENTMGVLLSALNYNKTISDSNAGSRQGARGIAVSPVATGLGAAAVSGQKGEKTTFRPVPIEDVRTIGFSKAWQGSGIVPSFIGSLTQREKLNEANRANKYGIDFTTLQHGELRPANLKFLYEKSPTFRDAQDRSAFALALTDMDANRDIAEKNLAIDGGDSGATRLYKQNGAAYLERVQATYRAAAELAYSAQTGKPLHLGNATNRMIRHEMVEALPHLKEDIVNKSNYRAFLLRLQADHPEMVDDGYMGRVAQAAKDTVEHGRWLTASDPTYAQHRIAQTSMGR